MEFDVAILSPEKTILTFRLAGLGARVWAQLLDVFIIFATLIGASLIVAFLQFVSDEYLASGAIVFFSFAFPFLYFILFEALWNGQTPGKKIMGVRVRMTDGTPVTVLAALGRNLLRVADLLPGVYLLGLIAIFTNPRSQRIGDLVANTIVIYERRAFPNFATAPHRAGVHPLEESVGPLRGMTAEEYHALRRFADRFPELSAGVQSKLLDEVWRPIAEKRNVPSVPNVHPLYLMEAVVMKYGREHGLL